MLKSLKYVYVKCLIKLLILCFEINVGYEFMHLFCCIVDYLSARFLSDSNKPKETCIFFLNFLTCNVLWPKVLEILFHPIHYKTIIFLGCFPIRQFEIILNHCLNLFWWGANRGKSGKGRKSSSLDELRAMTSQMHKSI